MSVARGYDVTRYALNCFGGAGGQHACDVADALAHRDGADPPAFVAAFGLWHGARRRSAPLQGRASMSRSMARPRRRDLERRGCSAHERRRNWRRRESSAARHRDQCRARLRYAGSDTALEASFRSADARVACARDLRARAQGALRLHRQGKPIVVEPIHAEAAAAARAIGSATQTPAKADGAASGANAAASLSGAWRDAKSVVRDDLAPATRGRRPRAHRRAASDHRRRARLAGGDHAPRTTS